MGSAPWEVSCSTPCPGHTPGPTAVLTTPEPRFIQTMVREGFPVQAQLNTASEPRSTRRDCGSVAILGPTAQRKLELLPVTARKPRTKQLRGSSGRS